MNGFARILLPRIRRTASSIACMVVLTVATPLYAASAQPRPASTPAIPAALRTAIDRTLGTDEWTQTQEVTADDPGFTPQFGISVALHGTTAMIGAQQAKIGDNEDQGAVYVYEQSGGTWTQTQKLVASDGAAFDTFGHSIAFDGTTAFIGAYGATLDENPSTGAVYVFTLADGTWNETQKLTADDGQGNANFGYSIAFSGSTAVIGADGATVGSNDFQGAAYVFTLTDGTWT
jgi:hypothetical protein